MSDQGPGEQHDQLAYWFGRAVELAPDARAEFLRAHLADEALRARIERLLAEDEDPDDPISHAMADAAEIATAIALPRAIGAYRPLRKLGMGGMGTVYLAERSDGRYQGQVAIKVLNGLSSAGAQERFRRERELLAQLDHPRVARLIDAGELRDGTPYVVMEYVDGEPIDRYCKSRALSLEARIELMVQAADAVQHAHRRLIVHRDLKPENMLVRADGGLKLLDFGIAKALDGSERTVGNATIAYTPGYASPEQRQGGPITAASDIYSLGVLLAEMLIGEQLPRGPEGRPREIRPSALTSDASLRRRLRGDLDTIVAKAAHLDPERRYATAAALAEDLRRYLSHRPISARPDSLGYRLGKLITRHPFATAASVCATLALLVTLAALKIQRDQARAAEQRAAQAAAGAQATAEFLSTLFTDADPSLRGENLTALELLMRGADRIEAQNTQQPAVRAELKTTLATALMNLGEMRRGLELARGAVADSSTDTLAARRTKAERLRLLAQLQWRNEDAQGALATVDEALNLVTPEELPADTEVRLRNTRVAALRQVSIDAVDSVRYAEEAMRVAQARLPEGSFLRAAARANLANVYEDAERFPELLKLRWEVLDEFERDPKAMPGDRWLAQLAFARALRLNGRADEALRMTTDAALALTRHYPGPHPNAAFALGMLAEIELAVGHVDDALAHARQACAMWKLVQYRGDEDASQFVLARALIAKGLREEALTLREPLRASTNRRLRDAAERLFADPPK